MKWTISMAYMQMTGTLNKGVYNKFREFSSYNLKNVRHFRNVKLLITTITTEKNC